MFIKQIFGWSKASWEIAQSNSAANLTITYHLSSTINRIFWYSDLNQSKLLHRFVIG